MDKLIYQIQDLEKQLNLTKHEYTKSVDRLRATDTELQNVKDQLTAEQRTQLELRGEIANVKSAADSKEREILALRKEMTDKTNLVESLQQSITNIQKEKDEERLRYASQISTMLSSIVKSKEYYLAKDKTPNNSNEVNVKPWIEPLDEYHNNHPSPVLPPNGNSNHNDNGKEDDEPMGSNAPLSLRSDSSEGSTLPMMVNEMYPDNHSDSITYCRFRNR